MAIPKDKLFLQVGDEAMPEIRQAISSANSSGAELLQEDFVYLDEINSQVREPEIARFAENEVTLRDMAIELLPLPNRRHKANREIDIQNNMRTVRAWFSRDVERREVEIGRYTYEQGTSIEIDGELVSVNDMKRPELVALARDMWPGYKRYLRSTGYTTQELRAQLGKKTIRELESQLELGGGKKADYIKRLAKLNREELASIYDAISPIPSYIMFGELYQEALEFFEFIGESYTVESVDYEEQPIVMLGNEYIGTTLFTLDGTQRRRALLALLLTGRMNQRVTKRGDAYTKPEQGRDIDPEQLDGGDAEGTPDGSFRVRESSLSGALDAAESYIDQATGRTYLDNYWASAELYYDYDETFDSWYYYLEYDYYNNYGEAA